MMFGDILFSTVVFSGVDTDPIRDLGNHWRNQCPPTSVWNKVNSDYYSVIQCGG